MNYPYEVEIAGKWWPCKVFAVEADGMSMIELEMYVHERQAARNYPMTNVPPEKLRVRADQTDAERFMKNGNGGWE